MVVVLHKIVDFVLQCIVMNYGNSFTFISLYKG
jgi:hypothetical protein